MPLVNKTIGAINVAVRATTTKFARDLSLARKALGNFTSFAKSSAKIIATLGAAFAGVAVVVSTSFIKSQFEAVDALKKTADKLNIATSRLAGLELAASEAGVEAGTLNKALTMLVKNTSEAAAGTGEATEAFGMLGINAVQLNRLSVDRQLLVIAEAMKGVRNEQDKLRIATDLFGSRAAQMILVLNKGRAGFLEAQQAAHNLGLTVSNAAAAGIERANDAFGRFRSAIRGVFRQIAVGIAPFIEFISLGLTSLLSQNGRARKFGQTVAGLAVKVFLAIGDAFHTAIQVFLDVLALFAKAVVALFKFTQTGDAGAASKAAQKVAGIAASFQGVAKPSARFAQFQASVAASQARTANARRQAAFNETINQRVAKFRGGVREEQKQVRLQEKMVQLLNEINRWAQGNRTDFFEPALFGSQTGF